MSGRGYNMKPLYREYLGAPLNLTMKCPLATKHFADRDFDKTGRGPSIVLYPTNNWRSKHFDYGTEVGGYVNPDKGFSMVGITGLNFGVLASDVAMTRYGNQMLSGHPSPGGDFGQIGTMTNDHVGYSLGTELETPINFVDVDGSGHTYKMSYHSYLDTDNCAQNRGIGSSSRGMLLPRDLGR